MLTMYSLALSSSAYNDSGSFLHSVSLKLPPTAAGKRGAGWKGNIFS